MERFLEAVHAVRVTGAGVPETSYYPAISRLLEDVGAMLSPKVKPVLQLRNQGSGIPDGGLFVVRANGPLGAPDPMMTSVPERGAVEVKPAERDLDKVLGSKQVRSYLSRYGKVLLTTMRDWALVTVGPNGRAKRGESFALAETEDAFWALTAHPRAFAQSHEDAFTEFLHLVMVKDAPLSNPADVAWALASHARLALERIQAKGTTALKPLRDALSKSLGLTFQDTEGEHFFQSTLVQTLFYGIFSAWVLWHRSDPERQDHFAWKEAVWFLRVPMVSVLFEQIAKPSTLRPLGLAEIMDWTEEVLARVDRRVFFRRFELDNAVTYFYEPFLEHFDASLRAQFGVWYTPPAVVTYMVEHIDRVLREDFGLHKGFADERVVVLEPCVGTGSFLVSVLKKIAEGLPPDALAAQDVKAAALKRVFGFEVLPAPFVVAHLQLGLLLDDLGAPLNPDHDERVGVYLTNALTGWAEEKDGVALPFPELEQEREAAHGVKRDAKVLVVLGNPPYYPFAGVNSAEEADLIEPYREGVTTKNSLGDLYVRFIRVAERRIVESTGHGIVCLITNSSYLSEPGFTQMRRLLLDEFDQIKVDNLNGDSRETGKRTPTGAPDPSIFSTARNREGIQVGTAIGLFIRRRNHKAERATVLYRDFWGATKADQLKALVDAGDPETGYAEVTLTEVNHLAFRPGIFSADYESWPQVVELAATEPSLGLNENRGGALIDIDKVALVARLKAYFDPSATMADLRHGPAERLARRWARFDPERVRGAALGTGFTPEHVVNFLALPLDVQWAYVDLTPKLWNEVRSRLANDASQPTRFLLVRNRSPRANDGAAVLPATCLGDQHVLHKDAYYVPFRTYSPGATDNKLFGPTSSVNLSQPAKEYLSALGIAEAETDYEAVLWWHILAVCYSPAYLKGNTGGIAADWPRIPLPARAAALRASALLGQRLAELLDPLRPLPKGLPSVVGVLKTTDGKQADPGQGHLEVRAAWGHVQTNGTVMPGSGKLSHRSFTEAEKRILGASAHVLGHACDVYLNEYTYWSCVPESAWNFKVGGFQVLKKWLSYREHGLGQPALLSRGLTVAEAREFAYLAQRLTGVVAMSPELDRNFERVVAQPWSWRR